MFDWPEPTYAWVTQLNGRRDVGLVEHRDIDGVPFLLLHRHAHPGWETWFDDPVTAVSVAGVMAIDPTTKEAIEAHIEAEMASIDRARLQNRSE